MIPSDLIFWNRHSTRHTQTREAHSLRSVTSGTCTAVASDCVLTDLSVTAHVTSILALINI